MAVKKVKKNKANPYKLALVVLVAIAAVAIWVAFNQGFAQGKISGSAETKEKLTNEPATIGVPDHYVVGEGWASIGATCYPLKKTGSCTSAVSEGTTRMLTDYANKVPPRTVYQRVQAPIQFHSTNCYGYGNMVNCSGY